MLLLVYDLFIERSVVAPLALFTLPLTVCLLIAVLLPPPLLPDCYIYFLVSSKMS